MSDLHRAIRRGDIADVRRLLTVGMPVDIREEYPWGWTALMQACFERGLQVWFKDDSEQTRTEIFKVLLDAGADVNAWTRPELKDPLPLLAAMITYLRPEEARLLIARGMNVDVRYGSGETALQAAVSGHQFELFDILLAAGASPAGWYKHAGHTTNMLSEAGEFGRLAKVLALGESLAPLRWTPLCYAIVYGSAAEVATEIDAGADLEHLDHCNRTPFLLALHAGKREIAELLLNRGANGRAIAAGQFVIRDEEGNAVSKGFANNWMAVRYAIVRDDVEMLQWLLDCISEGRVGNSRLDHAVSYEDTERIECLKRTGYIPENELRDCLMQAARENAVACFRLLLEAGAEWRKADPSGYSVIGATNSLEIGKMLVERGADPASLFHPVMVQYLGLKTDSRVNLTWQDCLDGFYQRFGTTNPERIRIPFWDTMVRGGWSPFQVDDWFRHTLGRCEGSRPWCYRRDGLTLTSLPDGRIVQVGGSYRTRFEHADNCIYNDVIVHDGRGDFEIYGYPEAVFPPTEDHSATLVGEWIYLIGNLGYPEMRGSETPVFRLHVESLMIEKVTTSGESPGWIHGHQAALIGSRIRVAGAKKIVLTESPTGFPMSNPPPDLPLRQIETTVAHPAIYWLDLATGVWEREDLPSV